ncbi:MAG: hypothetical protein CMH82_02775 [Nocardioides sp.]|nr:hypothetical protein [Nocardioides sp.]
MARNLIQICNEAISDLPAHPISGLDDQRKEARECSRHLNGVVADLLDEHDYDFANRRVTLAPVANTREGEWAYAYRLPDEIISPIKLVRTYNASAVDMVVTPVLYWPGLDLATLGYFEIDYEIANNTLFTNLEQAVLEYSVDAVEPNKWPPLFAQAVIRLLAARIYRPILGEKADTGEWRVKQQAAAYAAAQARASDLNRNPRQRKGHVSEAEIARRGGGVWLR